MTTPKTPPQLDPQLADAVLAVLRTENCWMSSHALLQQCERARNGEQLAGVLAMLVSSGQVQAHSDSIGLLYGVPGLVPPEERLRTAKAPAPAAERLTPNAGDQAAKPRIAVLRAQNVAAREAAIRADLVSLFRAQTVRTCRELQPLLKLSQPTVSRYLRLLCDEGLIEQRGRGNAVVFRWLGEPAAAQEPSPGAAELANPPASARPDAVASRPTTEAVGDARFCLFSDGELTILAHHHVTKLDAGTTTALIRFLRAARGAAEFVA